MGTVAEQARAAFATRAWAKVHALLGPTLDGDDAAGDAADAERLAIAAYLIGRDADSARAWERAHRLGRQSGDAPGAARSAFWLGLQLLLGGSHAPASGWLARAARLLEASGAPCAATGLLLVPEFMQTLGSGDVARAEEMATRMLQIAEICGDSDLEAFGLLCLGEARLAAGGLDAGIRCFDEAMVPVSSGEASPIAVGIVYCAVIEACMHGCDLRRASEWTAALATWCAAQPDLVPFRGQCLVHRSQVLLAHGEWESAGREAERAREQLSDPPHPALGNALYHLGELARLQGRLDDANAAYRAAHLEGCEPTPGLALLRLAEGRTEAAQATVAGMLTETTPGPGQAPTLAAAVEIFLAAGSIERAEEAASDLAALPGAAQIPLVGAMLGHARGALAVARSAPSEALGPLREAVEHWRRLDMPYELARSRLQLGLAWRELGDPDHADLEFSSARAALQRLGARPELERLERLSGASGRDRSSGLTARERDVLRLVAAGRTNRGVAVDLRISEHTVARHLQNIFLKLAVPSRAAAIAYAYEHGLI